jgi:23S rRNA (uracil1939-C5)-methyltransferase
MAKQPQPPEMDRDAQGWVLYDASCGVCSRWVPFWGPTLARQGLGFAPLQSDWVVERMALTAEAPPPEEIASDLRLLLANGELISGADVYRHVMGCIWWAMPMHVLTRLPGLRQIFDGVYRAFAAHRHEISRACRMPAPSAKPASPEPSKAGTQRKPRHGDEFEFSLVGFDRRGWSRGSTGEWSVRMRGGAPRDRWRGTVIRRRRSLLEIRGLELIEAGPAHREAPCSHHNSCGGCSFQECSYEEQLVQKHRLVTDALGAAGVLGLASVEAVIGCENPWAYRNKMEFSFSNRRWIEADEPPGAPADFALGLHAPGRFDKALALSECRILFPGGEAILQSAGRLARELGLAPWSVRNHTGCLRHLVLRHGVYTGEIMVVLVTSEETPELVLTYAKALLAAQPCITTLVHAINTGVASVARGESERVIFGSGYIEEQLLGLHFRISAGSFFQINTRQAEILFRMVVEEAAPTGEEIVYDLYSGAGTIALLLAAAAREVLAFEEVPAAVADARRSAAANGVEGVRFFEGDVLVELDRALGGAPELPRPDVVVVDPPRSGLHPKVPAKLLELAPRRLIYVSCNLHNGASDIAQLIEGGYRLRRVQAVDLFPHTPHVECVLSLEWAGPQPGLADSEG